MRRLFSLNFAGSLYKTFDYMYVGIAALLLNLLTVFVVQFIFRLQGAKLTAWELEQEGIDHAIIADNAAGYFMKKGDVNLAIVPPVAP